MIEYQFYDTNESGTADFDISGKDYFNLLNKCFEHCSVLSFFIRSANVSLPAAMNVIVILAKSVPTTFLHRISTAFLPSQTACSVGSMAGVTTIRKILSSTEQTAAFFFHQLFTMDFSSFPPRDDEDVSSIINNPNWIKRSAS